MMHDTPSRHSARARHLASGGARISRSAHGAFMALLIFGIMSEAYADETGVSYWLPGRFSSLAATPQVPGWSMAAVYYHTTVEASGAVAAARQIQIGRFPANVNVNFNARSERAGRSRPAQPHLYVRHAGAWRTIGDRRHRPVRPGQHEHRWNAHHRTRTAGGNAHRNHLGFSLTSVGDLYPQQPR